MRESVWEQKVSTLNALLCRILDAAATIGDNPNGVMRAAISSYDANCGQVGHSEHIMNWTMN
jgi:hypothetical protein